MECPICGAELEWEDSYGTLDFIIHEDMNGKRGDIYRCPNHEGFEEIDDCMDYILNHYNKNNENLTQNEFNMIISRYLEEFGLEDITEVCCESCCNSVSGSFHTDMQDNLYEGYPC